MLRQIQDFHRGDANLLSDQIFPYLHGNEQNCVEKWEARPKFVYVDPPLFSYGKSNIAFGKS